MTLIEKIKSLLQYLPNKDIPIANKFIEEHAYDSLLDLVVSAMERADKYKDSEEYEDIDLGKLNALRYEVSNYINMLYPEDIKYYGEEY